MTKKSKRQKDVAALNEKDSEQTSGKTIDLNAPTEKKPRVSFSALSGREELIKILDDLKEGLQKGTIELENDDGRVRMPVDDRIGLDMKAESKEHKHKLKIKLHWNSKK